jgi:hypothetical protein
MLDEQVPSFPLYVTVPTWAAILLPILFWIWRLRDTCAAFLLLAIWFRYAMATLHEYTYPSIIIGLSPIALSSLATIAVGIVVVGARGLLLRRLLPIYGVIAIISISAIGNQAWLGAINATFKWVYLIVFALAAYRAVQRCGSEQVFRALAILYAAPIALQWLSVPWGLKTTAVDGTSFYIGGYESQQALSITFLTFLVVTCFSSSLGAIAAFGRLAIVTVGLVLANYRTSLIAAALPASTLVVSKLMPKFVPKQRLAAFMLLVVVIGFALVGIAVLERQRFSDIGVIYDEGASLIKPPSYFAPADRHLLSGRLYLWSQYIDAYLGGDLVNAFVGFGPESWVGRFTTYAHNTFVSYLYEYGVIGLAAFFWLLGSNLRTAVRARSDRRPMLIACHVGFIVLNLSTMAIWTLEGSILYALILGQTWHQQAIKRVPAAIENARNERFRLPQGIQTLS